LDNGNILPCYPISFPLSWLLRPIASLLKMYDQDRATSFFLVTWLDCWSSAAGPGYIVFRSKRRRIKQADFRPSIEISQLVNESGQAKRCRVAGSRHWPCYDINRWPQASKRQAVTRIPKPTRRRAKVLCRKTEGPSLSARETPSLD
jgi:hypothetical protein